MFSIGKLWLSNKKNCLLNIVTSALIWSLWKLRNEFCFQKIAWRSMEMLLVRIAGTLQSWALLCPEGKRPLLSEYVAKIKDIPRTLLWLPDIQRATP